MPMAFGQLLALLHLLADAVGLGLESAVARSLAG